MNVTNREHSLSQGANTDFKPLIDVFAALEYATKYASKPEKGSRSFEKLVADAINNKHLDPTDSNARSFCSFLVQQTGGRNWSSQEVGHVLMGHRSVLSSHEFIRASVGEYRKVKTVDEGDKDDDPGTFMNDLDKYFLRTKWEVFGNIADYLLPENLSFVEFYRKYKFGSAGQSSLAHTHRMHTAYIHSTPTQRPHTLNTAPLQHVLTMNSDQMLGNNQSVLSILHKHRLFLHRKLLQSYSICDCRSREEGRAFYSNSTCTYCCHGQTR
jgi:hypothetical protein